MTKCERCGGSVLTEAFSDAQGSGNAAICLSCGDCQETYTKRNHGSMTAAEFARQGQAGRPRRVAG